MSIAPGLGDETAVGDALVVVPAQPHRLARVAVADAQRATLVVSKPAGEPGGVAAGGLAVARAQPLTGDAPGSAPSPSPVPQPAPEPAPAAEPVSVEATPSQPGAGPVVAGVDEDDDPQGPSTAVVDEFGPIEVCEGDEYALSLLLYIELVAGGEPSETLALHFEGIESEGTVYLAGASVGIVELVDQLLAEDECLTITVEVAAQPEGAAPLPAAELPALPPSPAP